MKGQGLTLSDLGHDNAGYKYIEKESISLQITTPSLKP